MRPIVVLSVIVFTILACGEDEVIDKPPVVEEPVNVNLIVPGQEIAGVKLGDRYGFSRLHGKPSAEFYSEDFGVTKTVWNNGLEVYRNHSYYVFQIAIQEPNSAKTVGGNGIGSTRDDVKTEFVRRTLNVGQYHVEGVSTFTEYWDKEGIEFQYDLPSWKVKRIIITPKVTEE